MEIKEDESVSSYFCGPCKEVVLNFYHFECKLKENQELLLNFRGKLYDVEKEKSTIESLNDKKVDENQFFEFLPEEKAEDQRVMVNVDDADDISVNEMELNTEEVIVIITNESGNEESRPTTDPESESCNIKIEDVTPEVVKKGEEIIIITTNDESEESQPTLHEQVENKIEVISSADSDVIEEIFKENKPKKIRPPRKFKCKLCYQFFFQQKPLHLHIKKCHPNVNIENKTIEEMTVRICKACDMKFENRSSYQNHIKTHRPFICELCGKGFQKKTYLEDHKEMHMSYKRYVCNYCGKSFRQRCTFKVHLRIHVMPGSYICEICGQAFNAKSTMNMHISLVHLKDKQFPCDLCGRTFPMKQTLMKHIARHNKERERTFKCKDCPMTYWEAFSLRRHVSTKHAGEVEKVPCNFCGKKYTTKSILQRHMKVSHDHIWDVSNSLEEMEFVKIEQDIDVREEIIEVA